MQTTRGMAALAVVGLMACGSSTAGPEATLYLAHGIVAGQSQIVTAGTTQLGGPVVEQLVRTVDGKLAFRRVDDGMGARVLDLIVPRAFAQTGTVVTGSPVVGAVVCAVNTDPAHTLVPFVPCTNTGSDGKATFFFTPGTTSGDARAEIRGTVANAPAVFDTAKATVLAGPVAEIMLVFSDSQASSFNTPTIAVGGSVDLHKVIRLVFDKYRNLIAPSVRTMTTDLQGLPDTTTAYTPSYAVRNSSLNVVPSAPDATGWIVTPGLPSHSQATVFLFAGTTVAMQFYIRMQ